MRALGFGRAVPALILVLAVPADGRSQAAPVHPAPGRVFVANGSGDSRALTDSLKQALWESGMPMQVETCQWCRHGRLILDHRDVEAQLRAGSVLAERVALSRHRNPQERIYLVGHSAGAHVVLAAAAKLPPGLVDRVVLLAPAISRRYDLRPALRCCRAGIDSFHSARDFMVTGSMVVGTADGDWGPAAGKVGFSAVPSDEADGALYRNLRQHAWNGKMLETGHLGGHFGMARGNFLHTYVVPLLAP